jgi:hypothetical protein
MELPSGATLTMPLDELWPTLGQRNDLEISFGYGESNPADATLLFNEQPETTCTRDESSIRCPDLGSDVTSISLRPIDAGPSGQTVLTYVFMHDLECESTHEPCPL